MSNELYRLMLATAHAVPSRKSADTTPEGKYLRETWLGVVHDLGMNEEEAHLQASRMRATIMRKSLGRV